MTARTGILSRKKQTKNITWCAFDWALPASSRGGSVRTPYVLPTSIVLPLESKEPTLPTLLLVGRDSSGRGWESLIERAPISVRTYSIRICAQHYQLEILNNVSSACVHVLRRFPSNLCAHAKTTCTRPSSPGAQEGLGTRLPFN